MRVVTYARVSTLGQETEGQSLQNQERDFLRYLERGNHTRLHPYKEHRSAKTIAGRAEFSRMIADLPTLKPDAIVIQTLDRFTRRVKDGLDMIEELQAQKVGLVVLDWGERVLDLSEDGDDWDEIHSEFTTAQKERKRIRRRVIRSYQGRIERGATITNRAAFGTRRQGDLIVADEETGWIIKEADARILAGHTIAATSEWARAMHPKAWRTYTGLSLALGNDIYVNVGLRTLADHQRLQEVRAIFKGVRKRTHDHEFSGIFKCGFCGRFMGGVIQNRLDAVHCAKHLDIYPQRFYVAVRRFAPQWNSILAAWSEDDQAIEEWAGQQTTDPQQRAIERQLSALEQQEARLKARRNNAFEHLNDANAAIASQARQTLEDIHADERALYTSRQALNAQWRQQKRPERDPERLRDILSKIGEYYEAATLRERNAINRELCRIVGSHPTLRRIGGRSRHDEVVIEWPEFAPRARATKQQPRHSSRERASSRPS